MRENFKFRKLTSNIVMPHFEDELNEFLNDIYIKLVIIEGNEPYYLNFFYDPQVEKAVFQLGYFSHVENEVENYDGEPSRLLYNMFLKECLQIDSNFCFTGNQNDIYRVFAVFRSRVNECIEKLNFPSHFEFSTGMVIIE